jgi:hypothetical protein
VVGNDDPDGQCRLEISVPMLMKQPVSKCLPALPFAGPGAGMAVVPPIGAAVWVEWPGGDLSKQAIWSGAWWPPKQAGVPGAGPGTLVLLTPGGHRVELSDDDGSITLTSSGGASITIGDDGIVLDNGRGAKLELSGPGISLNNGAFEVDGDG